MSRTNMMRIDNDRVPMLRLGLLCILTFVITFTFVVYMNYAYGQTEDTTDAPVSILLGIPSDITKGLPDCVIVKDSTCTLPLLHRVDVVIKRPGYAVYTLYHKAPNGDIYMATASRTTVAPREIWLIQGQNAWRKLLTLAKQNMLDPTDVIGPKDYAWVKEQSQAVCELASSATLVDVTCKLQSDPLIGQTCEVGTLKPIPDVTTEVCTAPGVCTTQTKPRTYPEGSVYQCGTGNFYLRLSKYGLGPIHDWPEEIVGYGLHIRDRIMKFIPANVWDAPVARTTKTCHNVPTATPCP